MTAAIPQERTFAGTIDALNHMTTIDWMVFAAIMLLTLGAVLYGHFRKRAHPENSSLLDYLILGRTLTLPMFTATLVATWYGGIFGVTEIAFQYGIYNFVTQGVFWYVTYLLFAFFLVHRVAQYKALTLPDLVHQMFGPRSAKVAAVFNFFNVVPVAYSMSLGLLLQLFIGGELWGNMLLGTSIVCLYSLFGGFRAVVYSDLVQFAVMCGAVALVLGFSVTTLGGLSFLQASLPPSHFEITGGNSLATTLVWGFIALGTLVDPNFYQRCFAADKVETAKWGIVAATIIWCSFDICTTLGGMYARATIPMAEANQSYLIYALQILPPGFRGFFVAGLVATILSTLDSYIFIASNTISYDLAPEKLRGNKTLQVLSIFFVGCLSVVLALYFEGSLKDVWKTLGSYSAGCLLLPVLYGYIRPGRLSDWQFVLCTLGGAIAITYWRGTQHTGFWENVDDLYIGAATTLLILVGSQLGRRRTITEPME